MLETYLDQLKRAASEAEVDLIEACKAEGIALTTLQRWEKGENFPREGTAEKLLARISRMRKSVPEDMKVAS